MRKIRDIRFDGRRTAKAAGIIAVAALAIAVISVLTRAYAYDDLHAYKIRAIWDSEGVSERAYHKAFALAESRGDHDQIREWLAIVDTEFGRREIAQMARFSREHPKAASVAARDDFAAGKRQLLACWAGWGNVAPGARDELASSAYRVVVIGRFSDVIEESDGIHRELVIRYCDDYNTEMLRLVAADPAVPGAAMAVGDE